MADSLPFEGRWTKQGETCVAGQPAPLVLTAKRLEARTVMNCDFTSVLPGGISFRVEADCEASGQKGHEFFTFAVLSGRLYWSWGGQTGGFDRCTD